jgi:hypothetical protein
MAKFGYFVKHVSKKEYSVTNSLYFGKKSWKMTTIALLFSDQFSSVIFVPLNAWKLFWQMHENYFGNILQHLIKKLCAGFSWWNVN